MGISWDHTNCSTYQEVYFGLEHSTPWPAPKILNGREGEGEGAGGSVIGNSLCIQKTQISHVPLSTLLS